MTRRVLALVSLLGLVLVAACGTAGPPRGEGGALVATNPYGANRDIEGTPKHGDTLVLGMDREIVSFDPTVQNANPAAFAVYDSLLKLNKDGSASPYLASAMTSPDGGLTWRLSLRPGVRFSDGTPLDATAVMINIHRHIDTPSSPAHRDATRIVAMRAVDPLTVELTLRAPLGAFPVLFAQPITSGSLGLIVSPTALRRYGDQIGAHPVGAGPFTFVSWTRDAKLVLARNPDYWQPGLPYLDGLEFRALPDTESRFASVQNGDVDLIFGGYQDELVRATRDPNLRVYYGPGNAGEYLYFNFARPPFNDRRMREAVIRALDLTALSASQYHSRLVRADSLFDPSSPYHTAAASADWPGYDQARARALVADYTRGGGNPNITFKTTITRRPFAEYLQAQLAAVGIGVRPVIYDLAQFSSSVVQSNDFELTTWISIIDSPFPGVSRLLRSDGNANYGKYTNPEVDSLLDTAASTTDTSVRTSAYQRVERLANRDLAVAFFSRGYLSTITRPEVRGIDRYLSRDMFYATTWLDRTS
jgi:ABC-type transport system substrate-binding protein